MMQFLAAAMSSIPPDVLCTDTRGNFNFARTNKEAVADTIIEPDHNSATHELVAAD